MAKQQTLLKKPAPCLHHRRPRVARRLCRALPPLQTVSLRPELFLNLKTDLRISHHLFSLFSSRPSTLCIGCSLAP